MPAPLLLPVVKSAGQVTPVAVGTPHPPLARRVFLPHRGGIGTRFGKEGYDKSGFEMGVAVLNYRVAYRMQMGAFFAEVLDFPEATAIGATVAEARHNLASALRYAAETRLRRGEFLPMPDPNRSAPDAYTLEMATLAPGVDNRVAVQIG